MKRLLLISLLLITMSIFTACGDNKTNNKKEITTIESEVSYEQEIFKFLGIDKNEITTKELDYMQFYECNGLDINVQSQDVATAIWNTLSFWWFSQA